MSDGWLRFPVPKDRPLADLFIEADGVKHPAFRENDHATIRASVLGSSTRKVIKVWAGDEVVHTTVMTLP